MSITLQLYSVSLSDKGLVRDNNEDSFLALPELGLFAVADGMGGMAAGEVASKMAIDGILESARHIPDALFLQDSSLAGRQQIFDWMTRAYSSINDSIQAIVREDSSLRGMGCTLDVALFRGNGVFLAHTGDSRSYLVRGGFLYQLTEDHSLGQMFLSSGVLTPEQVANHPQRNVLTRALGPFPKVELDTAYYELAPGDIFLICSDGLYNDLSPETLLEHLRADPKQAVPSLVQAALAAGGKDNITAVVVSVAECGVRPVIIGSERARAAMRRSDLFGALTPSELIRVQKSALGQQFAAGDLIIEQGKSYEAIYLNLAGEHTVWRDAQRIGHGGVGDPFGEFSLTPQPASVSLRAETDVTVLVFPFEQLFALLEAEPKIFAKIAMGLLGRISQRMKGVLHSLSQYRALYGQLPPE